MTENVAVRLKVSADLFHSADQVRRDHQMRSCHLPVAGAGVSGASPDTPVKLSSEGRGLCSICGPTGPIDPGSRFSGVFGPVSWAGFSPSSNNRPIFSAPEAADVDCCGVTEGIGGIGVFGP